MARNVLDSFWGPRSAVGPTPVISAQAKGIAQTKDRTPAMSAQANGVAQTKDPTPAMSAQAKGIAPIAAPLSVKRSDESLGTDHDLVRIGNLYTSYDNQY